MQAIVPDVIAHAEHPVGQTTHKFVVEFKAYPAAQTQQYVVELPQAQPVDDIDVHVEPDEADNK